MNESEYEDFVDSFAADDSELFDTDLEDDLDEMIADFGYDQFDLYDGE